MRNYAIRCKEENNTIRALQRNIHNVKKIIFYNKKQFAPLHAMQHFRHLFRHFFKALNFIQYEELYNRQKHFLHAMLMDRSLYCIAETLKCIVENRLLRFSSILLSLLSRFHIQISMLRSIGHCRHE